MVSIITSLYKSDNYLDAYAKNLKIFADFLTVQGLPFEVIVIANEPTTREKQLVTDFAGQSWFKFIAVDREPLYASWNRGVELSVGEIVGFWNVDDVRFPEAVVEAAELFKGGMELVYFPFIIKRYLKIFGRYFCVYHQDINKQVPEFSEASKREFLRSMLCGPFFMFTKALYQKVGPFDEQFKIAGDFDWCIRAAKTSNELVRAKSPAGEFRVDGGGLSAGQNARLVAENNVICRRHHIPDKIKPEDPELAKEYQPDKIKFKNGFLPIANH